MSLSGFATMEVALGMFLVTGVLRRTALASTCGLLVLFTAVLRRLVMVPAPVARGIQTADDPVFGLLSSIARNEALVPVALWCLVERQRSRDRSDRSSGGGTATGLRARLSRSLPGFSLIEVLVSIAIIGVLIAIALPVLGAVRSAAARTVELSGIRQVAAMVSQYADDAGGMFPFVGVPGDPLAGYVRRDPSGAPTLSVSYFRANMASYTDALKVAGFDATPLSGRTDAELEDFYRTFHRDHVPARYWLTHAVCAESRYWVGEDPPYQAEDFAAQRIGGVLFPSAKCLLYRIDPPKKETDPAHGWFAAVDGSADRVPHSDFELFGRGFGAVPWVGLMTERGVAGRDR